MTLPRTYLFLLFLLATNLLSAQPKEKREKLTIDGQVVTALITETDTILIADLGDVSVSSLRTFADRDDYRRYLKYKRYAAKVYPFAAQGIRIFKEMEAATANMNKRKRKRHIRRLQKELKKEFKKPLKGLTRTQGKILVKMIEKELDRDFYGLMKELRGTVTASYYHGFSKMYGYDLKKKYKEGDDKILDIVLRDFDLSYEVEELED
ncbi:MAG: DUF4294 domain-containing protein [Saprospiraceae bacterium]